MATIGNNVPATSSQIIAVADLHLTVLSKHTWVATANQEVWKFWIDEYIATSGSTVEMGLYDITSSEVNGILVASGSVASANSPGWLGVEITPVALILGHTYAVAVVASSATFKGGHVAWESSTSTRTQAIAALPATLAATSTEANPLSLYAETRDITSGSAIEITGVNGGNSVADGDTGVNIAGIDFDAITNTVTISPGAVDHIDAVVQSVVTTNSTTSIDITVDLPTGSNSEDLVYFYVEDDSSNVSAAYAVSVTSELISVSCSLLLTIDGTPSGSGVVCTAVSFADGISVEIWPAGVEANKEVASLVTAVSVLDTDTPLYNCFFTFTPSDANGDLIKFVYGAAGTIESVTGGIAFAVGTYDGTVCA